MATIVHSGIHLGGLRSGILGGAFKPDVMEKNGQQAKDKQQAVRWIDQLLRKGLQFSSACPTPASDGSCPGHQAVAERAADLKGA